MSEIDNILGDYQPPSGLEKAANSMRSVGHKIGMVPMLGMFVGAPLTALAALLDTTDGFLNKGFGKGIKSAVSGIADSVVTGVTSSVVTVGGLATPIPTFWMLGNWFGTLASGGDTIGELARKGANGVMDSILPDSFSGKKSPTELARETQVLGANPMMTASVPAGIGYAQMPQPQIAMNPMAEPNQWRQMVAQQRGQSVEQADQAWMSANHEDAAALRAAQQQQLQAGVS